MPIYEYQCDKCGAHLEVIQRMGEKPLKRCTKCKGKLQKIVSKSSFQLKGSGWYATDYSAKKPDSTKTQDSPKSETKVEPSVGSKTESKTDSSSVSAD